MYSQALGGALQSLFFLDYSFKIQVLGGQSIILRILFLDLLILVDEKARVQKGQGEFGFDFLRLAHRRDTVAKIPKFPDIPRPGIVMKQFGAARAQAGGLPAKIGLFQHMIHQGQNIALSLPQRRDK
jgi:hypothetical protein